VACRAWEGAQTDWLIRQSGSSPEVLATTDPTPRGQVWTPRILTRHPGAASGDAIPDCVSHGLIRMVLAYKALAVTGWTRVCTDAALAEA